MECVAVVSRTVTAAIAVYLHYRFYVCCLLPFDASRMTLSTRAEARFSSTARLTTRLPLLALQNEADERGLVTC